MAFEAFCIVEIMGHQVIAGKVSEETHFGAPLMRVDVPKSSKRDGFTCYYGGNAIYKITPTTEDVVQAFVEKQDPEPIKPYMLALPTLIEKVAAQDEYASLYDEDDHLYPDDDDDFGYPSEHDDDDDIDDGAIHVGDPWDEYDRRKDDLPALSDEQVDELLDAIQKNNDTPDGQS